MHKSGIPCLFITALALGYCFAGAQTPVYKVLYLPQITKSGENPTTLLETSPGVFSVMTASGGNLWGSTVITVTSAGASKVIYSLPPYTSSIAMVQGTNGVLYGPTFLSQLPANIATYFSLSASGQTVKQYSFPGQWGSASETVLAPPGTMYDIAVGVGSSNTKNFALAQIQENGQITILPQFPSGAVTPAAGGAPGAAGLVIGGDGNFYGIGYPASSTTREINDYVFRLTPSGTYSALASFTVPSLTSASVALVAASDGNLYAASRGGGANHTGQINQVTLSGQAQLVASFPPKSQALAEPGTLMEAADGNLYGTTFKYEIFKYDLTTKALTNVYQLATNGAQGACPCQMVQGMDSKLYAAAPGGGAYPGIGAVFSLDIGLPKPLPVVAGLYPASGPVGQQLILWGNYMLGATAVMFNGVPATTFQVTSMRSVKVTVPSGATTGPVLVTTANGTSTKTQTFTLN